MIQLNPYQFIGSLIVSTSLLTLPVKPAVALSINEISDLAYEITVKITDADTGYNGSGVIFRQEENVYSVLSNQHVVASGSTYEIQTVDGVVHPVISQFDIAGLDLIVLQFESEESYQVAAMGDSDDITPLQTIYVSGFPASSSGLDLTPGAIRSIDRSVMENPEPKLGYALLYSNPTLPGSSGGPVIDEDGFVVAINGQAQRDMVSGRDLSRGIPIDLFKSVSTNFSTELESESQREPGSEPEAELNNILAQAFDRYSSSYFLAYNPIGHDDSVTSIAVSNSGNLVASGSGDETINIWNGNTGQLLRTLEGHSKGINSLAIAPDGYTIVSGSEDKTIKVWNGNTGELLRTLEGHSKAVNSVAIATDGRTIISGSDDKNVLVWDWVNWELKAFLEGHERRVNSVAVAADGNTIVSGGDDRTVRVWDWQNAALKATLEGHQGDVLSVAIATDGNTLVSGDTRGDIRVWNWQSWELKLVIEGHDDWVNTVKISSDGNTIYTGSDDRSIKAWNLASGELENIFQDQNSDKIYSFATSSNEQIIVGGIRDRSIKIWHAK